MSAIKALGLIGTAGKTPEASLYAQVLTETKRRTKRGEQPRFVLHGKGFVGLAKWMGEGLAFQIEQHNRQVRKRLYESVRTMEPADFEELVGQLLTALGFEEVSVTARSGDGGIDVFGTLVVGEVIRTRMAVRVKRWRQNVQAPIVQQVRGSLGTHEQGLIITTSDFSKGAREEAARANAVPVGLMNGEQLVGTRNPFCWFVLCLVLVGAVSSARAAEAGFSLRCAEEWGNVFGGRKAAFHFVVTAPQPLGGVASWEWSVGGRVAARRQGGRFDLRARSAAHRHRGRILGLCRRVALAGHRVPVRRAPARRRVPNHRQVGCDTDTALPVCTPAALGE